VILVLVCTVVQLLDSHEHTLAEPDSYGARVLLRKRDDASSDYAAASSEVSSKRKTTLRRVVRKLVYGLHWCWLTNDDLD
jgi:hypothetical protein